MDACPAAPHTYKSPSQSSDVLWTTSGPSIISSLPRQTATQHRIDSLSTLASEKLGNPFPGFSSDGQPLLRPVLPATFPSTSCVQPHYLQGVPSVDLSASSACGSFQHVVSTVVTDSYNRWIHCYSTQSVASCSRAELPLPKKKEASYCSSTRKKKATA